MRKADIQDALEDQHYGKGNRGSDLPEELRRRQDRLARIRQARKEMGAETAAAAVRQRLEQAEVARDQAVSTQDADAPATEQAELNKKAEAAAAKAKDARKTAIKAAESAGIEPPDLGSLAADEMPRQGLARKADETPTDKTQRNRRCAEGCAYTDSHLRQSGDSCLQGYNSQLAVDSDHQVIVAVGEGGEQPTDGGGTSGAIALGIREVVAGAHRNQRRRLAQGDDAGQCGLLERGLRRPLPRPRHRCRHHHWAPGHTDCHRHRNATRCQRTPTPKHSWPASNKGSRIDAQRKAIVEPLNGQIKGTRGLRRFLLPSLEKVDAEWHLIAATHNPLKLFRFQRSQQQALAEQQQDEGKRPWKSGQS